MFTAPFTSAFIVVSQDSQTYKPRSTRLLSQIYTQYEHVLLVFSSPRGQRECRVPPLTHHLLEHELDVIVARIVSTVIVSEEGAGDGGDSGGGAPTLLESTNTQNYCIWRYECDS